MVMPKMTKELNSKCLRLCHFVIFYLNRGPHKKAMLEFCLKLTLF
jgi:hypothetical protein